MTNLQKIPEGLDGESASNLIYENDAELARRIEGVTAGVGNAEIGVAPSPNVDTYNVSRAGTYPLYGGLTVLDADLVGNLVQFRKINGVWQKFITPIPGAPLPIYSNNTIFDI